MEICFYKGQMPSSPSRVVNGQCCYLFSLREDLQTLEQYADSQTATQCKQQRFFPACLHSGEAELLLHRKVYLAQERPSALHSGALGTPLCCHYVETCRTLFSLVLLLSRLACYCGWKCTQ